MVGRRLQKLIRHQRNEAFIAACSANELCTSSLVGFILRDAGGKPLAELALQALAQRLRLSQLSELKSNDLCAVLGVVWALRECPASLAQCLPSLLQANCEALEPLEVVLSCLIMINLKLFPALPSVEKAITALTDDSQLQTHAIDLSFVVAALCSGVVEASSHNRSHGSALCGNLVRLLLAEQLQPRAKAKAAGAASLAPHGRRGSTLVHSRFQWLPRHSLQDLGINWDTSNPGSHPVQRPSAKNLMSILHSLVVLEGGTTSQGDLHLILLAAIEARGTATADFKVIAVMSHALLPWFYSFIWFVAVGPCILGI